MRKWAFWGFLLGLLGNIQVLLEFGDCEYMMGVSLLICVMLPTIPSYVKTGIEKYDLDIRSRVAFLSLYQQKVKEQACRMTVMMD